VAEVEFLQATPERALCEAVRIKPKMQWRPQKVRDTNNVECLPRKVTREWPCGLKIARPQGWGYLNP
jgi:hypothetical protein